MGQPMGLSGFHHDPVTPAGIARSFPAQAPWKGSLCTCFARLAFVVELGSMHNIPARIVIHFAVDRAFGPLFEGRAASRRRFFRRLYPCRAESERDILKSAIANEDAPW